MGATQSLGSNDTTPLRSCLDAVCTGTGGCVGYPSDPLYHADWVKAYNLAIDITPAAVVRPRTAGEISGAVKCASKNGLKVQAKSGGHSYGNYGLGGMDGEIMIDMANFQQVSVDNTTLLATIGAGSRLGDVTQKLHDAGGRATAHGVCPGVGIGGHATIGGLGPMSRMWGSCLDQIVEVEVVTADGTIQRASETLNPDLFWALRGAGASFGIITEFLVKTYPEPGEVVQYTFDMTLGSAIEAIPAFQAWQEMIVDPTLDRRFGTEFVLQPLGCLITGTFYGTHDEFMASGIPERLPMERGSTIIINDWLGALGADAEHESLYISDIPNNFYSKSLAFRPQDMIPPEGVETLFDWLDKAEKGTALWFVVFDASGGRVSDIPMNATAYAHRDKFMFYQSYAVGLLEVSKTIRNFLTGFHETLLGVLGGSNYGTYPGYVDPALTDGQQEYWGPNLPRLELIKARLDAGDLFHNPQSVRPALTPPS